jgi:hypothetical protein
MRKNELKYQAVSDITRVILTAIFQLQCIDIYFRTFKTKYQITGRNLASVYLKFQQYNTCLSLRFLTGVLFNSTIYSLKEVSNLYILPLLFLPSYLRRTMQRQTPSETGNALNGH